MFNKDQSDTFKRNTVFFSFLLCVLSYPIFFLLHQYQDRPESIAIRKLCQLEGLVQILIDGFQVILEFGL